MTDYCLALLGVIISGTNIKMLTTNQETKG